MKSAGQPTTQDLIELEQEVKFILEKILPEGSGTSFEEVSAHFRGWQSTPQYPVHQGLLKLVAEFYVRARKPDLRGATFFKQRNVIIDYLEKEFRGFNGIRDIESKRWRDVAAQISSLMVMVQ